jgi:hypothetical protein
MYMHMHMHMYMYMCMYMHMYMHMYMCMCMCMSMHMLHVVHVCTWILVGIPTCGAAALRAVYVDFIAKTR